MHISAHSSGLGTISLAAFVLGTGVLAAQTINLPTGQQLIGEIPGGARRVNSLPISMAVSPDGRYVVTVNAGFGTYESQYKQSLAVLDTATGALADFPDSRTPVQRQADALLRPGLQPRRAAHLRQHGFETDPAGNGKEATGSGVIVYSFVAGKIAPERLIPAADAAACAGAERRSWWAAWTAIRACRFRRRSRWWRKAARKSCWWRRISPTMCCCWTRRAAKSSSASIWRRAMRCRRRIRWRWRSRRTAARAYVALWNASEIVELDLADGTVGRKLALLKPSNPVAPGTHPCALEFSPDGKTLYVALANRDAVAAVNVGAGQFSVKGYFDTRLPHQSYFGAEPVALAVNADGSRLYAANMGSDAVAVIDTKKLTKSAARKGMVEPLGFVPTEWMPISMAFMPSPWRQAVRRHR